MTITVGFEEYKHIAGDCFLRRIGIHKGHCGDPRCHESYTIHICKPEYSHLSSMQEFYRTVGVVATSTWADIMLIRSHIAYWSGSQEAERATITPSRGHSYRVNKEVVVKITNTYDHRDGVIGWR